VAIGALIQKVVIVFCSPDTLQFSFDLAFLADRATAFRHEDYSRKAVKRFGTIHTN
jgi:hypothetical protein